MERESKIMMEQGSAQTGMSEYQKNFLLKEYDKLSGEVAKLLEETRTREKYSLTIVAAVSGWIYTEAIKTNLPKGKSILPTIHLLSCIPLIITAMYGISVFFLYLNIKWIGAYLREIETFMLIGQQDRTKWGWERYFDDKNRKGYFVAWTWALWILQLIIGIFILKKSFELT